MSDFARAARAAHNILTQTFRLRRDQNLVIFCDAASLEVVEVIGRAARELGIHATALFVPKALQSDLRPTDTLPLPIEAAVREADAILSCLSDAPEHLGYRMRVLSTSWSRQTKLAYAPGMTLEALCMADTDYAAISERAQSLALALILSRRIEILTTDSQRQEHRLNAQIGGWSSPPGIGDGAISDGSWGNLPPGEVHIAPRGSEGRIVVNGSLPGKVLGANEELIATFRAGRLVEIQPEGSPAGRHLRDTQIAHAERRGDPDWANLAEIGFGLNPSVQNLTGVAMVDEKKAHTIHVGLGHSATLGGDVESLIHCALVVKKPTVYVNGRLILKRGDWRLNEVDWRLDHRTVAVPAGWWDRVATIGRSGVRTERDNGRLVCVWNAGRGRWDSAPVGVEGTARAAARFYELLPENGNMVWKDKLCADAVRGGLPATALPGLLWVMHQFDLVRFATQGNIT